MRRKTATLYKICSANQWTGFYMIGTSIMRELTNELNLFHLTWVNNGIVANPVLQNYSETINQAIMKIAVSSV